MRFYAVMAGFAVGAACGAAGVYWVSTYGSRTAASYGNGHAGHEREGCEDDAHDHDHGHPARVVLATRAVRESGIETAIAAGGVIEETLRLPAEIGLDLDKVAHIVPRVSGLVRRVDKCLGDDVQANDVLMVLESRELAEAKGVFLAAQQRLSLARARVKSAEELHAKQIMPDLEFLSVRKALAEAQLELDTAEYRLHGLGLPHDQCARLSRDEPNLALCELRAPFAGTIVEKRCALGEYVTDQRQCFVLADLSTVWVLITVYPQDMSRVAVGQKVRVTAVGLDAETEISYVSPSVSEATRTATARAVLPNGDRRWKPGMFADASITIARATVRVLVPNDAVQLIDRTPVVFAAADDGFEPLPVTTGRSDATHTEIVAGLEPGRRYVARNAFIVKAEMSKGEAAHEH